MHGYAFINSYSYIPWIFICAFYISFKLEYSSFIYFLYMSGFLSITLLIIFYLVNLDEMVINIEQNFNFETFKEIFFASISGSSYFGLIVLISSTFNSFF
jgi:hypothetical protein